MMHEIAAKRRRFGYRRIGILLERDGYKMNHKKLFRLYQEEGLAVKRRKGRKRASGSRSEMPVPELPGQRWSLDFVSDSLQSGRRLRILAVNDDCTRENLCLIADFSFTGERVKKNNEENSLKLVNFSCQRSPRFLKLAIKHSLTVTPV